MHWTLNTLNTKYIQLPIKSAQFFFLCIYIDILALAYDTQQNPGRSFKNKTTNQESHSQRLSNDCQAAMTAHKQTHTQITYYVMNPLRKDVEEHLGKDINQLDFFCFCFLVFVWNAFNIMWSMILKTFTVPHVINNHLYFHHSTAGEQLSPLPPCTLWLSKFSPLQNIW